MVPDLLAESEANVGEGAEAKALGWGRPGTNECKVAEGGIVAIFEPALMIGTDGVDGRVVSKFSGDSLHAPDELGSWVQDEGN